MCSVPAGVLKATATEPGLAASGHELPETELPAVAASKLMIDGAACGVAVFAAATPVAAKSMLPTASPPKSNRFIVPPDHGPPNERPADGSVQMSGDSLEASNNWTT